jgi:hypothetical protein
LNDSRVLQLLLKSFLFEGDLLVLLVNLVLDIKIMKLGDQIMRALLLNILMANWGWLNPNL